MSHDQMDVTGQGCARYLSMFPGFFDEEAAHQVLSSSGFSDPSYCLQVLTKYSLIEQYTHYQQQTQITASCEELLCLHTT